MTAETTTSHTKDMKSIAGHRTLAARYAPVLFLDNAEPFRPERVGYALFRQDGPSLSFPRTIEVREPSRFVIEYALWWDWDIGHLYELEHVWVYVDDAGRIVRVEASWHGNYNEMRDNGKIPLVDGRPMVYAEPGKHAMAPSPEWHMRRARDIILSCTRLAGAGGIWENVLYGFPEVKSPRADRLVRTYLRRKAFTPTFQFNRRVEITAEMLVPWRQLEQEIPARLRAWVNHLSRSIPERQQTVLTIAHRGASARAPENTLQAIRLAAEMGADMVEMDVHLTADGVPVVIHDADLERTTSGSGCVEEMTLEEVQSLDAGNGQRVPTLYEALSLCRELGIGAYVELKAPGTPVAVALAVRQTHMTFYTIFGSFDPKLVREVKRVLPHAYTSVLFHDVEVDPVLLARQAQADYVHPCWENAAPRPDFILTPTWVERVHAQGLGVITWHEERPAVVRALCALGVDGICSDQPDIVTICKGEPQVPAASERAHTAGDQA